MRNSYTFRFVLAAILLSRLSQAMAFADWPQFRGVNASGISKEKLALPKTIVTAKHRWRTEIGKGHSSPVVVGSRIFLTAFENEMLKTIALDLKLGKRVWESVSEYTRLEKVHRIGSVATPSVVADDELVISFFGSTGLVAHDHEGQLVWKRKIGPFDNQFGSAASPILHGGTLITLHDHDTGSYLMATDKRTGKQKWRVDRHEFRRNYCTPVICKPDSTSFVVVAGTGRVTGYDLATGKLVWFIRRSSRVVSATPVVGPDNRLYVANSGGGEASNQPTFAELLASADANGNKKMEKNELPKSIIRNFISQFDLDKDGSLNESEYESIRKTMEYAKPVAFVADRAGVGDITSSAVRWTYTKSIPRNASSLVVGSNLFMLRDGGIMTVMDVETGKLSKSMRLRRGGKFFSSPICGDGKIYACSDRGEVYVLTADADCKQLSNSNLGEDIYASPAIAGGHVLIRTVKHLYAFTADP